MFVDLVFNLSLCFALLLAPAMLMLTHWYRQALGRPRFIWPRSELVIYTIGFFTVTLILAIIGVTCLFQVLGQMDGVRLQYVTRAHLFYYALSAFLLIAGLLQVYLAVRKMMMQMVMDHGIVLSRGFWPFLSAGSYVAWDRIADYYMVSDYPNVTFTFLVKEDSLKFNRVSIKVPVYLKDDFQAFVDAQMDHQHYPEPDQEFSSRNFYEN